MYSHKLEEGSQDNLLIVIEKHVLIIKKVVHKTENKAVTNFFMELYICFFAAFDTDSTK
jgi:hypothetical protein